MKKILYIVFAALMLASCGEDRSSLLKVYNWGDYIDEDLIGEFEEWYQEQTGEEVHIVYQTFDINETMLSKIEKGHEDYDVVCPSDYIIERMLRDDLVIPLNRDFGDTPNYIDSNLSPFIKECFNKIDGNGKNANDYSVAYMWGTTGFLYNEKYVTREDASTWNLLKDDRFIDKIFVKDACRDIYSVILQYVRKDDLKNGVTTRDEMMYDSSEESLQLVEDYMVEMRHRVAGWEADFGKEQMTQERGWINMTWSGDAQWAIEEAVEVGVPLAYNVPDEGSNIWFDGWVIPKYAKNIKAASYFINFMCRPDVAIRNMDAIGYVSAIGSPEILEGMEDEESYPETVNASYFFGPEADSVHLCPVMYPDQSVVDRCSMMHDWGDESEKLIAMWARVKGNQLSGWTIFVIAAAVSGIIASDIINVIKKRKRAERRKRRISGHAERQATA